MSPTYWRNAALTWTDPELSEHTIDLHQYSIYLYGTNERRLQITGGAGFKVTARGHKSGHGITMDAIVAWVLTTRDWCCSWRLLLLMHSRRPFGVHCNVCLVKMVSVDETLTHTIDINYGFMRCITQKCMHGVARTWSDACMCVYMYFCKNACLCVCVYAYMYVRVYGIFISLLGFPFPTKGMPPLYLLMLLLI